MKLVERRSPTGFALAGALLYATKNVACWTTGHPEHRARNGSIHPYHRYVWCGTGPRRLVRLCSSHPTVPMSSCPGPWPVNATFREKSGGMNAAVA
ncbi:hypothetical protein VCV18_009337 [Metarhizium anisopliae]